MSEISRELQEQQGNVGNVFKKLFPEAPAISTDEEHAEVDAEVDAERKSAQERAMVILAHVRELGDDY